MKEIAIFTGNKIGALAEVCEALGKAGVNIRAVSAQAVGEDAIIRLITEDATSASKALSNFKIRVEDILIVKMKDRPGELGKIARKLAVSGVDIESVYIIGKINGDMEVAIKPADFAKGNAVLSAVLR